MATTHLSQCCSCSTLFVRLSVGVGSDQLVIIYGPHRARFSSTFSPPVFFSSLLSLGLREGLVRFFLASFSFAALTLLVSAKFSFACFIFSLSSSHFLFFFFCISSLFGATKSFVCLRQARRLLLGAVQPVQPCVFFFFAVEALATLSR